MGNAAVGNLGPAKLDLIGVRAGDKNEMNLTIKIAGVPLNLTGMTLAAQARLKTTDTGLAPVIATVSIIGDPEDGRVNVRWPGSQITAILNGKATWKGVWDIQQITGSEDPVTLIAGTFQAEQDVTR